MSTKINNRRFTGSGLLVALAALAGALLLPATAKADTVPTPMVQPAIPGLLNLPGAVAPAAKPAQNMGILKASKDEGPSGTHFTLSGSSLPAGKDVQIHWMTASATWLLDPRPDSVDYRGRQLTKFPTVIATGKTDANGSLSIDITAPKDFGGIHDIYAVIDGTQVAKGGFLVERTFSMTPKKGPIGTMVTLELHGIGSSLYESGGAVYYDNKFMGETMTNWTRGDVTVRFRASGPVGRHLIQFGDAVQGDYLNIEQSPIPWATGTYFWFNVTKDAGRPAPRIDWPVDVAPTLDARTTLSNAGLAPDSKAKAVLSKTSGPVLTQTAITATGLKPGKVDLAYSSVVGNRVNCTGQCWNFVAIPLGSGTASADGTLPATDVTIPDGLGGWHVVQISQNGKLMAQVPFYVKRSVVGNGVSSLVVKQGQHFTVHLKGIGWTQLDNTIAVDYDNSFIGYGCGFNSNGDVVMNLRATGAPGTHLIDMYPLLYTLQPSYANALFGMSPVLTYANDHPGLALGYHLPAIRLAITVTK